MSSNTTRISARRRRRSGILGDVSEASAVLGSLIQLVWQRKLFWLIPLMIAMLLLGALLLLEATPIGPLLYPVF